MKKKKRKKEVFSEKNNWSLRFDGNWKNRLIDFKYFCWFCCVGVVVANCDVVGGDVVVVGGGDVVAFIFCWWSCVDFVSGVV